MPITQVTPTQQINAYIEEQALRMMQKLIYNLKYVGEKCLNKARQSKAYKDQTGNLRSSLGYVLAIDGKIVTQSTFHLVRHGVEGLSNRSTYAKEVIRQYPTGIVLVVVAGMSYASYVAAKKGDVLDSAELLAEKLVPKMLKKLGFTE